MKFFKRMKPEQIRLYGLYRPVSGYSYSIDSVLAERNVADPLHPECVVYRNIESGPYFGSVGNMWVEQEGCVSTDKEKLKQEASRVLLKTFNDRLREIGLVKDAINNLKDL